LRGLDGLLVAYVGAMMRIDCCPLQWIWHTSRFSAIPS